MSNKWNKNYIKIGVVFTVSVCVCIFFAQIIKEWKRIFDVIGQFFSALTPVIIGIVLAFLLNPIMLYIRKGLAFVGYKFKTRKSKTDKIAAETDRKKIVSAMERARQKEQDAELYDNIYRKTKIPSLFLTVLVFLGLLAGFFSLVIPRVYESLKLLVEEIPIYLKELQAWVDKMFSKSGNLEGRLTNAINYIEENVLSFMEKKIMPNMDTIVLKVSSGVMIGVKAIFNFLIGLIVMVYLLASKEVLIAQGKKMIYCMFSKKNGNKILSGLGYANSVFGGFINGKILDSFIIGIICFIFTKFMGMTYAVLISITVGVTNIIPFFGPFIGAVPGAMLAIMDDPIMFVIFIVFILCLQQFDGNILGPLILGDSTGLSGMWVLFAILIGGDLFGVPGMILGVPVFACLYAFVAVQLRDKLRAKKLSSKTEDYFRLIGFDANGKPMYRDKHEERFTARQRKRRKKRLYLKMVKENKNKADEDADKDAKENTDFQDIVNDVPENTNEDTNEDTAENTVKENNDSSENSENKSSENK